MISFDDFLMEDGTPIYLQILYFVQRGIVAGTITDGDQLPSRRVLSAWIGVNPNTIQKAYRLLEEDGIIESHSGAKSLITVDTDKIMRIRAQLLAQDTQALVQNMKRMGISREEALRLIEEAWDQATGKENDEQ